MASDDDLIAHGDAISSGKTPPAITSGATLVVHPGTPDDALTSRGATISAPVEPSKAQPGDIDPLTHRPYAFIGGPGTGPVAQSTGTGTIAESGGPGLATSAELSLATDPEQRRRIAASLLFPHLDPKDAQSRVFYGTDNRLAAVGLNGQPFYVDAPPYQPSLSDPRTWIPGSLGSRAGSVVGPAIPATGATILGAGTAPGSLVFAPAFAGLGAAIGDVGRQQAANALDPGNAWTGERTPYNPWQTGTEALAGAGGQLVGGTVARLMRPNPLAAAPADLANVRRVLPQAELAQQEANRLGITLTPGQASGLPSLLGHEDTIASGSIGGAPADIAAAFYQRQRQQLEDARNRMLAGVSPVTDKDDAAMQFRQAAEDAERAARQQANAAARPSYQAAQARGNVMSPDLAQLSEVPAVRDALTAARADYANLYRRAAPDTPDFQLWDLAKRRLDDMVSVQRRAGENTAAASIDSLRSDLLTHLDAAYPEYATARATAAPGQQVSQRLQDVLRTGGAPDLGTDRARAMVAPVFNTNNPRAISEARQAFINAGREDEWNAGTRAYVQDLFDQASKSAEGLNPSMLLRQVWRDPDKRAAIEAAMDPAAFRGMNNFMQVLENVARSRGMNSLTAPRLAGANALAAAAADTPVQKTIRGAFNLASSRLLELPARVGDRIAGFLQQRNMSSIARNLFSDQGMDYLRSMGAWSPASRVAAAATARFLGTLAGGAAAPSGPLTPDTVNPFDIDAIRGRLGMAP